MRYFSLVLLLVTLILTFTDAQAQEPERGYCIQLASGYLSQPLIKEARLIDCREGVNSVRVEKVGKFYVLRVGFWKSEEEARRVYSQLKGRFKNAILRTCVLKPERIVFSGCSEGGAPDKSSEEEEPEGGGVSDEVEEPSPEEGNYTEYTLTLREIGYPRDLILSGHTFSHTFYIPVLPAVEAGVFHIRLGLSPTVPKDGRITVFINDVPYKTYTVSSLGLLSTLEVPLFKDRWSSFCKVRLSFNFLPEGGICRALNIKDIYATVYNSSTLYFKVNRDYEPSEILFYLLGYDGELQVEGRNPYALALTGYYLATLYRKFSLYNLDFSEEGRRVVLGGETSLGALELRLNPSDLQAGKFIWPLKSRSFSGEVFKRELPYGQFIPFSFFGFKTLTVKGIGDVSLSFNLPFSGLGGRPKKLLLLLKYAVQDLSPESGDRLWSSLLVNGKLVWSRELSSSPFLQENLIEVPSDALEFGENRFTVLFSYYPGMGTCEGTVPSIRATLYDTSAVSLFPLSRDFTSVVELLRSLGGRVGLVVEGKFSKEFILELFKLLGYYSPYASELSPYSPDEEFDFVIVVRPFSKTQASSIPVRYDEGIKIVNPLTGEVALKVKGSYSFILFQTGSYSETPALYVSPSTQEAERLIENLSYSDFDRFLGNAVFLFEDALYPFQIGEKFRVEYSRKTAVVYLYRKYKFLIFIALFVLLTLTLVYAWRRLT